MLKKLLKSTLSGIVKSLPLSGFVNDLKLLKLKDQARKIADHQGSRELYKLLDALDDGELNGSFDKDLGQKIYELAVALITIITLILTLI